MTCAAPDCQRQAAALADCGGVRWALCQRHARTHHGPRWYCPDCQGAHPIPAARYCPTTTHPEETP